MTSPHLTSSPLAPWSTELVQLAVHTSTGDLAYRSLSHPAADRTWRPLRDTDDEAAAVTIESTEASDVPLAPLTLLTPLVEHLGGLAVLRRAAGLFGPVMEVTLLPLCPVCLTGDEAEPAADARLHLLASVDGASAAITMLCADHARLAGPFAQALTLDELAAATGAPLAWGDAATLRRLRPQLAPHRWAPPGRGPLWADRTVAGLRMGQTGYVPAGAIRLDGQRRLLMLDLDAPAPQRLTGPSVLPVRRTIRLGYETFVAIDYADRHDLAWSHPGPPVAGRNETRITSIHGLWATPLLATALGMPATEPGGDAETTTATPAQRTDR